MSIEDVSSAIDNHDRVRIRYRTSDKDESDGPRIIEPYALGLTKAGNPVLRAFERSGDSRSKKVPAWKFMRLDRIYDWTPTGETFDRPASDEFPEAGKFNPEGDRSMGTVYKIIKFGNTYGNTETPQTGPRLKSDVTPQQTSTEMAPGQTAQPENPVEVSNLKAQNGFENGTEPDRIEQGPKLKPESERETNDQNASEMEAQNGNSELERIASDLDKPMKLADYFGEPEEA
ncbi:MAG: WYL domain-containing protein [Bacteroidales bacterium]|nr:WYL domain-containing protein [Bacteroidales bacterium]